MIKVMAHELGHTLGAHHVGDAPCQSDPLSSVEPGSGTSIMGRAGKCGVYDVTPPPGDLYFNVINIEQMTDTLIGLPSCGTATPTGNATPTVDAGPDYTIPRATPFLLAGSGFDANSSDVLTFSWEQSDVGATVTDTVNGPVFRYRAPTTSPTRYLPALGTVLADTVNRWERTPVIDRLLHFRLTVRDNHPGGGAQAWDENTITVSGAPFAVTSPDGAEVIPSGVFPVTWTGGGGSVAATVNILLSTDGGATWESLATNTTNDGAEDVSYFTWTAQPACRIKVEAVGNIFYDVSHANFTIAASTTDAGTGTLSFALRNEGSNPTRRGMSLGFDLPRPAVIHLGVYSVSGRLVRTLASGKWPAGRHTAPWDGADSSGREEAAGVYVVRLAASGRHLETRVVLVR
jgi:hypothetical protein